MSSPGVDEDVAEEEAAARAGGAGHLAACVVPVLVGAGGLAYALTLRLGIPVDAGPGLWPAAVSVVLVGAGLWALVAGRRVRDVERFSRGALDIALGLASLVAHALLVPLVGFEIPTLLVLAFWLRVLGREPWRVTALVSLLTTAVFSLVLVVLLGVPLPRLAF
ncbi:tripartite tricarboxylate transporter TctB family protein [Actinoplanes sp. NPDC051346]|uniref:tripartite tricarboxylate transporter TctB family protein n=1 Tax=Actinoplanes sp. NPDC051346 TaxID=3155048 RepID=UPI0034200F08